MERMKICFSQKANLPSGLMIKKDIPLADGELELSEFLKVEDGGYVNGAEMMKRSKKIGGLTGYAHAQYLFSHQKEIPDEWKKFFLIFAGCELEDSVGYRRVPDMYFLDDRWHFVFCWLAYDFYGSCRLVRRCT